MNADEIRAHIDPIRHEFAEQRSLILPALKFAQTEKGHLTQEDLAAVAEAVELSPAYVESVASFYDRLYLRPTGTRVISVCVTLSCMLRGSDELLEHLCEREGLPHHGGTSEDGAITVQEAQCLGYCDRAGRMVYATAAFPEAVRCGQAEAAQERNLVLRLADGPLHVSFNPLATEAGPAGDRRAWPLMAVSTSSVESSVTFADVARAKRAKLSASSSAYRNGSRSPS